MNYQGKYWDTFHEDDKKISAKVGDYVYLQIDENTHS